MRNPATTRASAAHVARHFGVTAQYVGRLAKEGVISLGADGRYDLDATRLAYLKHLRARRSTKSDNDTEFRKLKSRELTLRIAKQEGSLIDLEECITLSEGLIGSFRAALAGLPARVTHDLALRGQIAVACEQILAQLADDLETKAATLCAGDSLVEAEAKMGADDAVEEEVD